MIFLLLLFSVALLSRSLQANSNIVSSVLQKAVQNGPHFVCTVNDFHHQSEVFEYFLQQVVSLEIPQLIIQADHTFKLDKVQHKCDVVVIFLENIDALDRQLKSLSSGSSWNRTAWYLIVVTSDKNLSQITTSFAKSVVNFGIMNSLLLKSKEKKVGKTMVFDFFTKSFRVLSNSQDAVDFLASDKMTDIKGYSLKIARSSHLLYLPFKLNGNNGILGKLVNEFTHSMNASVQWIDSGMESNFVEMLHDGLLDLIPFLKTDTISNDFDFIPLHTFDGYCLLMYDLPIGPYFEHLMVPFNEYVWAILLCVIIVVKIVSHFKKNLFQIDVVVAYFFGLQPHDYNLKRYDRFALMAFTWLFFLAGEAYLAKMISFMNDNKHTPRLRDLVDFQRSEFGFCESSLSFVDQFSESYPELLNKVDFQIQSCIHVVTCSSMVVYMKAFRTVTDQQFYSLDERLGWWISTSAFSSKQPFAERFRVISKYIFESGIWDRWIEQQKVVNEIKEFERFKVLNFTDLISLWWLLLYGNIISFSVYLVEYGMHLYRKLKRLSTKTLKVT